MDAAVIRLIEERAALEIEDRQEILRFEIGRITAESSSRGTLNSGMTVQAIQGVVRREARVRTTLVWISLARALTASGELLTDETATEAKDLISRLTRQHSADLQTHLEYAALLMRSELGVSAEGDLEAAFSRINTEVDFALLSAGRGSDADQPQTLNIYQSQGIIQTGPHATAAMTIIIGVEERQEITLALSAVRAALETDASLGDQERSNALQLVDETATELEKPEPNGLKVRSALQGLATTMQAVASAPQVYILLKGAASLLGLDLP